jgi:hypothetical protein
VGRPDVERARLGRALVVVPGAAVLVLVGAASENLRLGGPSTVAGADVVVALAVALLADCLGTAGFGFAISQAARLGGPLVIALVRVVAGGTAVAACLALAWWGPDQAGRIAVMAAVAVGVAAVWMNQPRPGPSSAGWWRWLSHRGSAASPDQWLEVVLRHAAATRDCRLALAFVEGMRPCLTQAVVRSWPEYVSGVALSAAGRYAEAAERLAQVRRSLPPDDVLADAVRHVHVDALLTDALGAGTTPPDAVLADCAGVLGRLTVDGPAAVAAVRHTGAMLRLFQGDPAGAAALALQARDGTTNRWDRAIVDATIAVALAGAGDVEQARRYARRVPQSCPLHEAACRATVADALTTPR